MATAKPVSNIAVAFAAQSASSNIVIPHEGKHAPGGHQPGPLPTPPNSISPTLSAHKRRPGVTGNGRTRSPLSPDLDVDLQDALDHAAAQDQPGSALSQEALAGLDATRQITAVMLAKHHLPGIILGHGAMPIREMMAHLTQSVPGFSRLAPAKARRLVVAALEHRAGGGLHGQVKFEKVGWGRWSVAGHSSRGVPIASHGSSRNGPTPPASVDSSGGLLIPKVSRHEPDVYSGSWAAGASDSPDEEMADRMSLDGSEDSASDTSEMDLENGLNDDTDEEDWSAMGPQALRQKRGSARPVYRDYNHLSRTSGARYRSTSAQSVPTSHAGRPSIPAFSTSSNTASRTFTGFSATSTVINPAGPSAERDAIEALIAMGSM